MRRHRLLPALLLLAASAAGTRASAADEAPFPPGESSQRLEGLACSIVMPPAFDAAKERSMLVILHGAGGTETGMARSLAHLAAEEFVIVAPKSKAQTWDASDLESVRKIVADLSKRLRVGAGRLHGAGFSNGGWNLAPVVFDGDLRFRSACWIAAGFKGGTPPKHAKKEMGVLALAGAQDPNRRAAEETPALLDGKVRSAEARVQPGLGHEWPEKLMPYYAWWLGVQEGRFVPGVCAAFDWADAADPKAGSFVYWYADADAGSEAAKTLQNDTFRDPLVQRFGAQLRSSKVSRESDPEGFAAAGLKETPAVVVRDAAGKVKASLQGKIDAKALSAALRAVAPDRSLPKD